MVLDPAITESHEDFCATHYKIRNKHGIPVQFWLQPAQQRLNEIIERCRAKRKPVRVVVLKARQVMISTAVAAEFHRRVYLNSGQRALIVAHQADASKNIYGYYSQFHDSIVESPLTFRNEVLQRADDRGLIRYGNDSEIRVATAVNLKTGRSASLRYLHLSEYAFWPDARVLMTGLMQCVPDDPDTAVIVESTANGVGGPFYNLVMEAMDPTSGSEWEFLFFAWWEHPEYRREIIDKPAFQAGLTKEELELQTRYHLTLEQIHWRRWAIKNKCQGSTEIFKQEYPSCPQEAFLYSGRPRFNHAMLAKMPVVRDAPVGELVAYQHGPKIVVAFEQQDRGALVLYKRPQPNRRYAIGIDVAEGIDPAALASLGDSDPDYSVAIVMDRDTGEQVAKLRGRMEPAPFAEYVAAVARWYNYAYLVPESNSVGIALLEGLLRDEYPPSLIYHRRPQPDEQFSDNAGSTQLQFLGWKNNTVTRVQLISKLDQAIREMSIQLHDPNTVAECQSFVVKANGKAEAQDGAHDDEVIALALCIVGIEQPPPDDRLQKFTAAQRAQRAALGMPVMASGGGSPTGPQRYGVRRPQGRDVAKLHF